MIVKKANLGRTLEVVRSFQAMPGKIPDIAEKRTRGVLTKITAPEDSYIGKKMGGTFTLTQDDGTEIVYYRRGKDVRLIE